MTEAYGVITSGVSIGAHAGQIDLSIKRLKTFLDQVKDAPKDIKKQLMRSRLSTSYYLKLKMNSLVTCP
jgi:hypothetical protein